MIEEYSDDLLCQAKQTLEICEVIYWSSLLDLAVLLDITGSSLRGCSWQPAVSQSARSKQILRMMQNLFEDSKYDRPKRNEELDVVIAQWIFHVSRFGEELRIMEDQYKTAQANPVPEISTDISNELAASVTKELETASRKYMIYYHSVFVSIYNKAVSSEESCIQLDEILPSTPEGLEFLQNIKEKSVTLTCLKSSELMDSVLPFGFDQLHAKNMELICYKRITLFNATMKKQGREKKLKLRLGKGCAVYANNMMEWTSLLAEAKMTKMGCLLNCCSATNFTAKPKPAKGCIDYGPTDMQIRECLFSKVTSIFKLYGAQPLDTPVFELKEVLTGKYGEDSKLIYDLLDQGGEQLALRYDLTVPFARYCATYGVERMKRYHIGKVYRRDEPQITRGRFREFVQCDVDFAGHSDPMLPDAEILMMICHLLSSLAPVIGDYEIKISHRLILDGLLDVAGITSTMIKSITSSIDKLDKCSWDEVKTEMVEQKNLSECVADRLKPLVMLSGSIEDTIKTIKAQESVYANESVRKGLADMELLDKLLKYVPHVRRKLKFTTSLARGLDYYTGLIYEATIIDQGVAVGSIAAGGRYDELIGMFSGKEIPAVGISLGVERIFRLIKDKCKIQDQQLVTEDGDTEHLPQTECYIATMGDVPIEHKIKLAILLRNCDIRVEYSMRKSNFKKELEHVLDMKCPMAVFLGTDELAKGTVKIKEFFTDAQKKEEIEIPIADLEKTVLAILKRRRGDLARILFTSVNLLG